MSDNDLWITVEGSDGPGKGKRILFISGDDEYRSEEALPMLAQVMARHHGFTSTVLFAIDPETGLVDPEVQTNIPGMHHVDTADMIVMFIRFRELPDEDMGRFIDYTFAGKPILALRTSTHAFQYGRDPAGRPSDCSGYRPASPYGKFTCFHVEYGGGFGRQVLGETWVDHHGHHAHEATRGVPNAAMKDHPILKGVRICRDNQVRIGLNHGGRKNEIDTAGKLPSRQINGRTATIVELNVLLQRITAGRMIHDLAYYNISLRVGNWWRRVLRAWRRRWKVSDRCPIFGQTVRYVRELTGKGGAVLVLD